MEACYLEHFAAVDRALRSLLPGPDRETVIHELFSRLIAHEDLRRSFQGGALAAWLVVVARNQAIDFQRRLGREVTTTDATSARTSSDAWEDAAQARLLVERFRRERLPPAWERVFELRFLEQRSQQEIAAELRLHRTTVAYRERGIRRLLKRFLVEKGKR
jgi:RNA polymerase sigma-70 factor (ECF subfamily)